MPNKGAFVKGDPRINRNGRPHASDELRELIRRIGDEPALDTNGNRIEGVEEGTWLSKIELVARAMYGNPEYWKLLLSYGWGLPTERLELVVEEDSDGPIPMRVVNYRDGLIGGEIMPALDDGEDTIGIQFTDSDE